VGEGQGLITVSVGARFFPLDALRHSVAYSDQAEGYYAYIEVRDNGSGITPDVLGRVFDPYFTTRFTGRGLGLAVVLGILRGHEGLILVQSEPGRGSSFQLLLPIVQAPQKEETPKIDQADAGEKFSGVALVVEGDKDARNVAEIMLRRLGLEPISAIDPLEALLLFEKHQHETRFILADLASLRRGAAESLKNMREMNPAVPIILISSQPPGMEPEPPAEGVFDAVLPKPYQKRDLVEALEAAQKKRGRPRA
jgi:CheY-like chemotaxis protein